MTFITLPQSGEIIDLDSVTFVVKGGAGAVGEIKVGVGGSKISFVLDDARRIPRAI